MFNVITTLCLHTHFENGVMVMHSHPSPDKEHTHTKAEYIHINHINATHALKAVFQYIEPVTLNYIYSVYISPDISFISNSIFGVSTLRAPPIFSLFQA